MQKCIGDMRSHEYTRKAIKSVVIGAYKAQDPLYTRLQLNIKYRNGFKPSAVGLPPCADEIGKKGTKGKEMKGYKGFEKGLICRGKQYAENTVFEEETAAICKSGMHFCENPFDVLGYYGYVNNNAELNEFAEVEALDECQTDDGEKFCTKKLKIGAKTASLLQRALKARHGAQWVVISPLPNGCTTKSKANTN